MKKVLIIGGGVGIGKHSVMLSKALTMAQEHDIDLVFEASKTLEEQIKENIPKESLTLIEAPKTFDEDFKIDKLEKLGVRGITNNRKLKKKRKKKAKKTHRKK